MTAAPAEAGRAIALEILTVGARPRVFHLRRLVQFHGEDTGRHGDDAIAHDHDEARQDAPEHCVRRDVAIANRRERDDCPVNAMRNTIEAVLIAFDETHESAHDEDNHDDREKKHDDLGPAGPERSYERLTLLQVMRELQDAEDAQESQDPDHEKVISGPSDEIDVARQKREEIDYAVEAKDVPPRIPDTEQARDVFERENEGEYPLETVQENRVCCAKRLHAFHHDHGHADPDRDQKRQIEHLSGARIALEDDGIETKLPHRLIACWAMPEECLARWHTRDDPAE